MNPTALQLSTVVASHSCTV